MEKCDFFHALILRILSNVESGNKFYDYLMGVLPYTVEKMEKKDAHSLYLLRRDLGDRSKEQLEQFNTVLNSMEEYSGEEVLIHTIQFPEKFFLFFTGSKVEYYLGYIEVPYRESE
ncbi:hypothetical protein CLV59_1011000 [Chitinophaga dinghuensis]|uniref:Uncharacterized protein n=1 Tax=Chitinophaga dinghuensis TaxID=1539050 RepID=A0A327WEA6_9BACT|nr:hypothetical protein [Chitinophaga dinghuensis]RAJ88232.1 hypothetical protein CLV59_1011000 [Chitinophaga dinghuensis]